MRTWTRRAGLTIGFLLVIVRAATDAEAKDCRRETPLPAEIQLTAPGPEVPEEIARFAGVWNGAWYEEGVPGLCNSLVVERLYPNGFAELIDSYGFHVPLDIKTPGYFRAVGRVKDGVLTYFNRSGKRLEFRWMDGGLRGTFEGEKDARFEAIASLAEISCGHGAAAPPQAPAGRRDRLTVATLQSPAASDGAPDHNGYYGPLGAHAPAKEPFTGRLALTDGRWYRSFEGCPGLTRDLPPLSLAFFTVGGDLVPVERGIIFPDGSAGYANLILSPGKVWSEPDDQGYSRAAFPFVFTTQVSNETHNALATFLYRGNEVSQVHFQIVEETAAWNRFDAWGSWAAVYETGGIEGLAALEAGYAAERADQMPMLPRAALIERIGADATDGLLGAWGREHVSAAGLAVEGQIYVAACQTRYGPHPYCRHMRHGVYSVTKSLGAALTLLRLAQKYGAEVFDLKVRDYLEINANQEAWDEVTFADLLNMAAGIGNNHPQREPLKPGADGSSPRDWRLAFDARTKLDIAFAHYGNLPWGPGEVMRYNTTHTFILSAAMNSLVTQREGREAKLWELMAEEVLQPIGVHHLPVLHTRAPDGSPGIPIFGSGSYPTIEDAAKIGLLLQNGGKHNGAQLLHPEKLAEALFRAGPAGLPTGNDNIFGDGRYHLSFWGKPYRNSEGCRSYLPAMLGYGGNIVALLPNGVVALRFADGFNYESQSIVAAGERFGTFCPTLARRSKPPEKPGERLSAETVRHAFTGHTFYADDWHSYLAADGTIFSASPDKYWLGRWRVDEEGHYCSLYETWRPGVESCYVVYRIGEGFEIWPTDRWDVTALRRVEGNPEGY